MPPRRHDLTQAELDQIVNRGTADVLATLNPARLCTYKEFLGCKPSNLAGTEGAIGLIRWIEKMESVFRLCNCPDDYKVKYSASTLLDDALTWWNAYTRTVGIDTAYQLTWEELKRIMKDKYCPPEEIHKLEVEFWHLTVRNNDIMSYTNRFDQLALLCPNMVNPEEQRIERYIRGLPLQIEGMVTASKPTTIHDAVRMAHRLMAQVVRRAPPTSENYHVNWNGDSSTSLNLTNQPQPLRSYTTEPKRKRGYTGNKPYCQGCKRHHEGTCGIPCDRCQRLGHKTWDCKVPANPGSQRTCFKCGEPGHYKKDCPGLRGNAYMIDYGQNSSHNIGMSFLKH